MRYAIYTRLSKSDDDRAVSLEQQAEACRRYVEAQGGTVALEAQDVQSGLEPNRPGYQNVLQAARDRRIDAAVVWRFDRWGRDTLEALRSFQELAGIGIEVLSATENFDDPFVRDLMLLLANKESRNISARVRPVMAMQAKAGQWQTRPPTGYDLAEGKLTPNGKAPLIRELFQRATGGASIASLRRWAQSAGLCSETGNPPSRSIVHKWLTNPVYTGAVVYNRQAKGRFEKRGKRPESEWVITPDAHPALVDGETFTAVQGVLQTHKRFQASVRGSQWLLTGVVRCGYCGARMYGRKGGRGTYNYFCYRGVDFGDCCQRFTGGATLDGWVKGQVGRFQITPELRQRAYEAVRAEAERTLNERTQQRGNVEAALTRHNETRGKLAHRVMADLIPPDVYRKLEEEEATAVRALEGELGKLEAPPPMPDLTPVMDVLATLKWSADSPLWETPDAEAWREIVALLVERVEVRGLGDYSLSWSPAGEALAKVLVA